MRVPEVRVEAADDEHTRSATDDEPLWRAIRDGEQSAFAELFRRHGDFVYNYAFRRTASWDVAEDVVSAVFLEAWRQRATVVAQDGSLRPWLVGVARNHVRRWWRGRRRLGRAVERLSAVEHVDDQASAVASRVDDERYMAAVLAAFDQLGGAHREVLLLWAWEGFSYGEIATALGISVGTVRSRLSRARGKLAELDGGVPESGTTARWWASGTDAPTEASRSAGTRRTGDPR
jgi:RNA polymerase sigma factor (sigma-70 family)